jgi:hypothetical protein
MIKSLIRFIYPFIFFACPKKTNQKKRQPVTCSAFSGMPCAAQNNRALRNSLRSDSPRAYPVIFPLLGCVKWQFKTTDIF